MSLYPSGLRFYSKLRVADGPEGRRTYQLAAGLDEAGAVQRDALLAELARALREVKTPAPYAVDTVIDPLLTKLASAPAGPEVARIEAYIRTRLLPGKRRAVAECPTLKQFGQWWTSGELARRYPEQVRVCATAEADGRRLERHVYRHIGDVLVSAVRLEDLEVVLRKLPAQMARSSKRHLLSRLHRLLDLAVYPARLLAHNPMPRGFKPKANKPSFPYLYPAEEARLLGCREVPLARRIAYGLAARTGLRVSEVCGLRWSDVDLELGALRLGEHKTVEYTGARVVPLDEATVRVLAWWQEASQSVYEAPSPGRQLRPLADRVIGWDAWIADRLLADLLRAGVDRTELHATTAHSRCLSFHGLRRTFVTLSLGAGRTEDWVMRRTGHTSSQMLGRYRIAAATAAEFGLGWLRPFDEALAEMGSQQVGRPAGVLTADRAGGEAVRDREESSEKGSGSKITRRFLSALRAREDNENSAENVGPTLELLGGVGGSGQPTDRLTALLEAADAEARRLDLPQVRIRVRAALAHTRLRRVK